MVTHAEQRPRPQQPPRAHGCFDAIAFGSLEWRLCSRGCVCSATCTRIKINWETRQIQESYLVNDERRSALFYTGTYITNNSFYFTQNTQVLDTVLSFAIFWAIISMYVCMYVCMVIACSSVWINRIRLPILLEVSWTGKMNIFPCPRSRLRIWSRETGSAVPSRVSLLILHTQAESGAYSRDSSRFPRWRHSPFIYTVNCHRVNPY